MNKLIYTLTIVLFTLTSCSEIDQTFHLYRVQNQTSENLTIFYQTVNDDISFSVTLGSGDFLNFEDHVQEGENEMFDSSELASLFITFEIQLEGEVIDFNLQNKDWVYYDGGVSSDNARVHDYRLEIITDDL